ncbi:hypothetical protein ACYFX5_19880 [Bremerella sp. T1]|uniref:hypothetical protein n=1 Tax=Bremerella sp. TYQ1 TaxID=3119568 RepID=UPI001CCCE692|nr:hypothetical protein [Bremerella volcania]UBM35304.1 hypothetical protein LA756_21830 [Bremerella volcania]
MITTNDKKPRFALGQVVATPGALEALESNEQTPMELIRRHVVLDPGVLGREDQEANEDALDDGGRIFSAFLLGDETKIYVITEADRSSTCILLPDEY